MTPLSPKGFAGLAAVLPPAIFHVVFLTNSICWLHWYAGYTIRAHVAYQRLAITTDSYQLVDTTGYTGYSQCRREAHGLQTKEDTMITRAPILTRLAIWAVPFFSATLAAPLSAQNPAGIQLMNDLAWHGLSDRVQVHQPSVQGKPPHIDVWERIAIGNAYGNWAYVKNLIDCQQWTQTPFYTIDRNGYFVLWSEAPSSAKAAWDAHGQGNETVIAGVCALYGFRKPLPNTAAPDKSGNFVER